MELEATWPRVIRIWWALAWRLALTGLFSAGIGAGLFLLGHPAGAATVPLATFACAIAALAWLCGSVMSLKLVLGTSLGGFRLALLPTNVVLPRHDEGQSDTTIRV